MVTVAHAVALLLVAFQDGGNSRTALLDAIWAQLRAHDAFFDANAPAVRAAHQRCRAELMATADEAQRLRHVVRLLCEIDDGHLSLSTRWFLPDKPPPPLPLAGAEPLFRPRIPWQRFRKDYYLRLGINAAIGDADGPAREARIVAIDGAPLRRGLAWALINGPRGTRVVLTVEDWDGRRSDVTFERDTPVIPPKHFAPTTQVVIKPPDGGPARKVTREVVVESRRIDGDVGYIRLEHLITTQVVNDFYAALREHADAAGLILDLRDTGGGYPWIMLPIAGRFMPQSVAVAQFEARSSMPGRLLSLIGPLGVPALHPHVRQPLVVLINDGTGSMSEGLAFALGDSGRALLVGRPTRGLNAAIRNVTLPGGLVLWHSWIQVNRLGRGHYQGVGVEPHERVELPAEAVRRLGVAQAAQEESRVQLAHAIRRLREMMASGG